MFILRMLRARRSVVVVGVVALALVLVGAGCRNPLRKKPEEVLARAQERMVDASGVRVHANLILDFDAPGAGGTPDRGHLSLTVDGAGSGKTPEETRGEGVITAELSSEDFDGKLVLAERAIGQTAYLQLQDLTVTVKGSDARAPRTQLQIDAMLGSVKGIIGGKWIEVDPQEILGLVKEFGGTKIAIPTPEERFTRQEQVRAALRAHPILLAREDLGNDRVENVSAYRYRVGINRDAIGSLVTTLATQFEVPPAEVDEVQRALQDPEVIARIDGFVGEMWIAKNGNDLLKLTAPIELPVANGGRAATGNLVVEFSDWGKPVTVEAPADAMKIQDLLGPFLGGMLGGGIGGGLTPGAPADVLDGTDAPARAFDLPPNVGGPIDINPDVDTDADGLSNDDEVRYGSNPNVSDTDGDGFSDGTEVGQGYSPTGPGRLTP